MGERHANGDGDRPPAPPNAGPRAWGHIFKRTVAEFRADNLTDWAASLTYYGVLALFPALVALMSIVGFLGHSTVQSLISNVNAIPGEGQAKDIVIKTIKNLSNHKGSAGLAFFLGL